MTVNKIHAAKNEANTAQHTFAATLLGLLAALGFGLGISNPLFFSLVAAAGVGFAVLVWRITAHDNRAWGIQVEPEIITVEKVVYRSPDKNYVTIGRQFIWQPKPGDFAQLMRHAIDNTRREFSLRSAVSFGWNENEYRAMVAQLIAHGWFSGDVHNRAFTPDADKVGDITDWLNMNPPAEEDFNN